MWSNRQDMIVVVMLAIERLLEMIVIGWCERSRPQQPDVDYHQHRSGAAALLARTKSYRG